MPVLPELDDLIENGGRLPQDQGRLSLARQLRAHPGEWLRHRARAFRSSRLVRRPGRSGSARLRGGAAGRVVGLRDRRSAPASADGFLAASVLSAGRQRPPARTTTGSILPNIGETARQAAHGRTRQLRQQHPHRATTTLTKFMSLRSFFTGKWADNNALKRSLKIYYQDQAIMEKVRRSSCPSTFRPS